MALPELQPEVPMFVKRTLIVEQTIVQARFLDHEQLDDPDYLEEQWSKIIPVCLHCLNPIEADQVARSWIHLEGKIVFLCSDCQDGGIGVMHDAAGDIVAFNPRPELDRPSIELAQAAKHIHQARGNVELACDALLKADRPHLLETLPATLDFLEGAASVLSSNLRDKGK